MELSTIEENMKNEDDLVNFMCDINSICRICLQKNQNNHSMYNIFEGKVQLHLGNMIMSCANMIMSCAAVQVLEGDGLPYLICQKCVATLNVAWQFKTQCELSDAKLRNFYNTSQIALSSSIDVLSLNIKEQQKNEEQEEDVTYHFNMPQTNPMHMNDFGEKECTVKKSSKHKSDKMKEPKVHQCHTCGKTFNRKEYLTQHIRIHTGEKPYHCHLCEKRFVNSGHLTTHMRTHTGERPHACNICPKAFSTRQELQKHTMVHNGDRPFVCKMCGKRFGSSSNLYSHLKHHTGEKNFTCEHCGKPFYTKQELKQHLVVHTGEKAFVCELCNKRFSQIAHLKRHSKLHK